MKPLLPYKIRRRTWEQEMVINRISTLPPKAKIKEITLVVLTWALWLFTLYVLFTKSHDILFAPIKFGLNGMQLLKILLMAFSVQISISLFWTWIVANKKKP